MKVRASVKPRSETRVRPPAPDVELPPYPTVSEIIAAVAETANRNLSQARPQPTDTVSSDHPA